MLRSLALHSNVCSFKFIIKAQAKTSTQTAMIGHSEKTRASSEQID